MTKASWPWRAAALLLGLSLMVASYLSVVRPWFRNWGATPDEIAAALPGDGIVVVAGGQETRAITIDAPAERVWPWLAQLGQDRAGFYSFEILEDLVGCEMPNLQHLDPALQRWQVGDKLWMYPPRKLGGAGSATLAVLEPGRALGFATRQMGSPPDGPATGSWSMIVRPIDSGHARLLFRGRIMAGQGALSAAFAVSVFEPAHFAMERRTLQSIKTLAEGGRVSSLEERWQVLLWTLTFGAFVAALGLVLAGRKPVRRLGAVLGAGAAFQLLTLGQPPLVIGTAAALAVLALLFWPARDARGKRRSVQRVRGLVPPPTVR